MPSSAVRPQLGQCTRPREPQHQFQLIAPTKTTPIAKLCNNVLEEEVTTTLATTPLLALREKVVLLVGSLNISLVTALTR
jgi:hypothetical protein